MSEGRKTRRFKETNDKAELDRQWKKISAVSACCWGWFFHAVDYQHIPGSRELPSSLLC